MIICSILATGLILLVYTLIRNAVKGQPAEEKPRVGDERVT